MAFLHTSTSTDGVRAFYPSPAGATESMLTLEGWDAVWSQRTRCSGDARAGRGGVARSTVSAEPAITTSHPIDRCFELVGLIRISWRGLSGGQEVWERIDTFFADLRAAARVKVRASA